MAKKGRRPLAEKIKRGHVVSVRCNLSDLTRLDAERGAATRGGHLYKIWSGHAPYVVPKINQEAWGKLGKMAGGVTYILKREQLSEEDRRLLVEIKTAVAGLRKELVGGRGK